RTRGRPVVRRRERARRSTRRPREPRGVASPWPRSAPCTLRPRGGRAPPKPKRSSSTAPYSPFDEYGLIMEVARPTNSVAGEVVVMHASARRLVALAVVGVGLSVFAAYAEGKRAAIARTNATGLTERQTTGSDA